MTRPPNNQKSLKEAIRIRQSRRKRWEKEGERPLARNLALAGSIGWIVVVPTLAGMFLGRWLDRLSGTGITFTAALLFVGVIGGCIMAWNRIHRE